MENKNNIYEWGDIITISLVSGDSFTVLLEETGRLSGKGCTINKLQDEPSVSMVRYATKEEIREFMRDLILAGRLLHQGFDTVNRPEHYVNPETKIECIDAMEAAFGTEVVMHFCLCNSFKYVFRSQKKNGMEDIKKSIWYNNKYIELGNKLNERRIKESA